MDTEEEREKLLELLQVISQSQDKEELQKQVFPKLRKLFDSEAIFLCLINPESQTLNPILRVGHGNNEVHPSMEELLIKNIPVIEGFIGSSLHSTEARVLNLSTLLELANQPSSIKTLLANGFASGLTKTLQFGNRQFGVITLWSKNGGFNKFQINLLDNIGSSLSSLIGNIVAEENYKREQEENEVLLAISDEIAAVRNKSDLTGILEKSLKSQIKYEEACITVFKPEKSIYEIYSYSVSKKRFEHPEFEKAICKASSVNDSERTPHIPRVLDVEQMVQAGSYEMIFILKSGIREIALVKLIDGESLRGLLVLMSESKGNFTESRLRIIRRISYQLSVAISKQIVWEELLQNQKQSDILMTMGKELAAIRKKEDLGPLLIRQLKNFSFYHDFTIAKINRENPMMFSSFLVNEESPRMENPEYPKMRSRHFIFPDGVFELALYAKAPVRFDLKKLAESNSIPPYIRFLIDNGVVEMIGAPLKDRNVAIGVFFCFSKVHKTISDFQMNIFQGISNLLSTSVANILANNRIEEQLIAINQYKELLEEENIYLQQEISGNYAFGDIIGTSEAMKEVYLKIKAVSGADSSVLLMGETGTGKELLARAVHNNSPRKKRLLVKVNCASIPEHLIESELFGHEKGAFTGALDRRIGKFELANQGTLFLDEIGELPLNLQPKLLRALQELEIQRIGGNNTIKVDVRIVAATNRNLEQAVFEGSFRSDLFYRLNVFPVSIPPLRERKEDIPPLALYFLQKISKRTGKKVNAIATSTMKSLVSYSWPGNVRELEHLIERSILLCNGNVLKSVILPNEKRLLNKSNSFPEIPKTHFEHERDYILHILEKCEGKIYGKGGAAEVLGLKVSTLNSKIKKLGIKKINPFD